LQPQQQLQQNETTSWLLATIKTAETHIFSRLKRKTSKKPEGITECGDEAWIP